MRYLIGIDDTDNLEKFVIPAGSLPIDGGGILGQWLGDGLAGVLGLLGSTLILLAVLLAGITLFSGLSWFRVIDLARIYAMTGRVDEAIEQLEQERQVGEFLEEAERQAAAEEWEA